MIYTIFKKETKENFLAMKGLLWLLVVALLFTGMTFSFITVKELSLLAQTAVMITMSRVIIGISLMITIILASVSFSNEKEQSTLESLMLTPLTNNQLAYGKLSGVLFMWFMILIIAIPYITVLSYGTNMGLSLFIFLFIFVSLVVFIYTTIAMSLSIYMGSSKNAMITALIMFIVTAIPTFLSTAMKKSGFGFILDRLSPLSNTIHLLKGMITNHQSPIELIQFIIPLFIYCIIGYLLMTSTIKKFSFEGEE